MNRTISRKGTNLCSAEVAKAVTGHFPCGFFLHQIQTTPVKQQMQHIFLNQLQQTSLSLKRWFPKLPLQVSPHFTSTFIHRLTSPTPKRWWGKGPSAKLDGKQKYSGAVCKYQPHERERIICFESEQRRDRGGEESSWGGRDRGRDEAAPRESVRWPKLQALIDKH